MIETSSLFDLTDFEYTGLFGQESPWEAIRKLPDYLAENANTRIDANVHPTAIIEGSVVVGVGTVIGPFAEIHGPTIIGDNCFVGNALVRQSILSGGTSVGHGCEVARSILLTGAQVPHNSVVPDSIVGRNVNVGGFTSFANLRLNESEVFIKVNGTRYSTGLTKFGALIGDNCKIGAQCLFMPGIILAPGCHVWPGVHVHRSYLTAGTLKAMQRVEFRRSVPIDT